MIIDTIFTHWIEVLTLDFLMLIFTSVMVLFFFGTFIKRWI